MFNIKQSGYNSMSHDLIHQLAKKGLYIQHISKENLQIIGIKDGILQVIVTDLGNRIIKFCYDNIERANTHTAGRDKDLIGKKLYETLAQDEQFANLDQNTTT